MIKEMPKCRSFALFALVASTFFLFSPAGGFLPLDYTYIIFAPLSLFLVPFFLRNRIEKRYFYTALTLFISGLVSSIGSGVPSAFLYSIGPVLLTISVSQPNIYRSPRQATISATILAWTLLLISFSLFILMVPDFHGRLFLPWVENPNYTAMLYLAVFLFIRVLIAGKCLHRRHLFSLLSYVLIVGIILATQTRSVVAALAVFLFISFLQKMGRQKLSRWLTTLILILTVFGQLIGFYAFQAIGVSADQRVTFGILDASNLTRFEAFHRAMLVAMSDPKFIWYGVGNVDGIWNTLASTGDVNHVPHNWFMMMWLSNGALFTLVVFLVLFVSCLKAPAILLPGFAALLIIGFILGRAVLFAPLCLFLIGFLHTVSTRRYLNQLVLGNNGFQVPSKGYALKKLM